MGNGHRMGAAMGSCECRCPGDRLGESEAQVPDYMGDHTSFLRKTQESTDPVFCFDKNSVAHVAYGDESKDRGDILHSNNGNGDLSFREGTHGSGASDSGESTMTPRVNPPCQQNKVSPVPKLVLPSNVYKEPNKGAPGRGRGAAGTSICFTDQAQFKHLPPLPEGWIRARSRTTGSIYYCFMSTGEATFLLPTTAGPPSSTKGEHDLPLGWHKMVSRSTGKTYYWNAELNKSQFDHPSTPASDKPHDTAGLPPGWVKMKSTRTGRAYYFNARSQSSQFEHPGEAVDETFINGSQDKVANQANSPDERTLG